MIATACQKLAGRKQGIRKQQSMPRSKRTIETEKKEHCGRAAGEGNGKTVGETKRTFQA